MTAKQMLPIIPDNIVVNKIYELRGVKVMLDSDLAELYFVETKRHNVQVGKNPDRFPEDFMFQLTDEEWLGRKKKTSLCFHRTWYIDAFKCIKY